MKKAGRRSSGRTSNDYQVIKYVKSKVVKSIKCHFEPRRGHFVAGPAYSFQVSFQRMLGSFE